MVFGKSNLLIQCLIESKVDISVVGDKYQTLWKYPVYLDQKNVLRQISHI